MDLAQIIRGLRAEKDAVERAIALLENLQSGGVQTGDRVSLSRAAMETRPKARRGRKSMGAAERQEVSKRVRRYWASHRKTSAVA